MRPLLFLFIFFIFFVGISQKRSGNDVIPQTQKDSVDFEAAIVEAEKHLIIEDYGRALEKFNKALEMNNKSAALHFKIAEVLSKLAEKQKALPYGLKAISIDPENKYYRLALARLYSSIGFYIDAAKTYEEMLERFPADENALYELAELYQLMGRTEEMFKIFDKIETQLGIKEEIVRERQRIYMQENKVDEVANEYRKLINAYPNESSHRLELIRFLIQNKKLDQAEREIETYEATEISTSRITLLKSEVAWIKGEREKSFKLMIEVFQTKTIDFETKFQIISNYLLMSPNAQDYEKLTKLAILLSDQYPKEFKAQAFVGDMLYQEGRHEEALSYYLKATYISPANYLIWQNILNIEADLNRYDSVIVHAEKALEYFPNQALLYHFAGTGYLINNDFKTAVKMLNQGKKYTIDPNFLTIFYGQLGDAYNSLKENDKSYMAYEKALQNKPDNDHVLNNYSYFLSMDKRDLDKALKMSKKLMAQHPNNPTYLDTHGWVLYVIGNYTESRKYLEKAVSLDNDDTTLIEHYGDVLFKLGDIEGAVEQWKHARDQGESSERIEKKIANRKMYE